MLNKKMKRKREREEEEIVVESFDEGKMLFVCVYVCGNGNEMRAFSVKLYELFFYLKWRTFHIQFRDYNTISFRRLWGFLIMLLLPVPFAGWLLIL